MDWGSRPTSRRAGGPVLCIGRELVELDLAVEVGDLGPGATGELDRDNFASTQNRPINARPGRQLARRESTTAGTTPTITGADGDMVK
jgi:hypothetical protein